MACGSILSPYVVKVSCFKDSGLGSASLLVNIVSNSRTTLGTKSLLKTYMQLSWEIKLQ